MSASGLKVLQWLFSEKPRAGGDEEAATIADQIRPILTEMMRQDIARGMEHH
jgi:hypothetical protein